MKRVLRTLEERASTMRSDFYYDSPTKRTKHEVQPPKESRVKDAKVQPKNLEGVIKLREENEKFKEIIKTLEAKLVKYETENVDVATEMELFRQEKRKIQLENESIKHINCALETQLVALKMQKSTMETDTDFLRQEFRKIQSENERIKQTNCALETQLVEFKMQNAKVQNEMDLLRQELSKIQSENVEMKQTNCDLETKLVENENSKKCLEARINQMPKESAMLPLLNEKNNPVEPAVSKIAMLEFLSINETEVVQNMKVTSGSEGKDVFDCLPISESAFVAWDISLNNRISFLKMKNFYLNINMKKEIDFVNACIKKTFEADFIQKIHFDSNNSFNDSNILLCLIGSVQDKFKDLNYDDVEAKSRIVAGFRRFRNSKCKRNARN